jgi:hypothetical protein
VTAIDLHSRHPSILEQDFLLMDHSEHREAWDAISLSLVLNFIPDGKDRGMYMLVVRVDYHLSCQWLADDVYRDLHRTGADASAFDAPFWWTVFSCCASYEL